MSIAFAHKTYVENSIEEVLHGMKEKVSEVNATLGIGRRSADDNLEEGSNNI